MVKFEPDPTDLSSWIQIPMLKVRGSVYSRDSNLSTSNAVDSKYAKQIDPACIFATTKKSDYKAFFAPEKDLDYK